ncbi:RHS repeat-associated core domain-containing protein [Promicromonospora sp. MEB111]|uniref:RHS repeat domain-containing protein n=1 Tax=Promicromonospora sp. MEB111 TaxID=3040301 RepID=UPI0025516347|nr:RHS repeat-associated core domain-containing protein [Promicromonospora sp. MEB111]
MAAAVVITLMGTGVVPATAAADDDRANWTLEERREYGEELKDTSLSSEETPVPAVDVDPDSPAPDLTGYEDTPEARVEADPVTWPAAGDVTLPLPAPAAGVAEGRAGGLPVQIEQAAAEQTAGKEAGAARSAVAAAGDVRVEHEPRSIAAQVGAIGGVITLDQSGSAAVTTSRTTASADETTRVRVGVDVGFLAGAGADLASRLTLVQLPQCALSTPELEECRTRVPLDHVTLDDQRGESATSGAMILSGEVDLLAEGTANTAARSASSTTAQSQTVVALMAEDEGPNGDWAATSLSASASWDVSEQTGSFNWSYPMRTPPVPGGLSPQLSLAYSSASLDGKVASSNTQSSQVGDGWEANVSGYVERKYVPCVEDQQDKNNVAPNNATRDTGDLCWKTNNATLVFNGSATELVRDGESDTWRPVNDDNTMVTRATGGWGEGEDGTDAGEYWIVTTDDGTKYYFGRNKTSATGAALGSVYFARVYSNHAGEPCNVTTYSGSACTMGWRWMLDYVEDVRGNTMTYTYNREVNRYGHNNNGGVTQYVTGGRLASIEYGTKTGSTAEAPARVAFSYGERCIPTSTFTCAAEDRTVEHGSHWPDLPLDLVCTSSTTCPDVQSQVFFDRFRMTGITTQIRSNGTLVGVDNWGLVQTLPTVGDSMPTLWLDTITHKGLGGNNDDTDDLALPVVDFTSEQLANRVNGIGDDGAKAMTRLRVNEILSESGGVTAIDYSGTECSSNVLPANPWSNDKRCMPVFFTPPGVEEATEHYFHHYRVERMTESAGSAIGGTLVTTDFVYTGGPAWHYDDNELVKAKERTWGELRGYSRVDVYTGDSGDANAPRLRTAYRYFQGMDGDRNDRDGNTVKSEDVDGITDLDQYAGMVREEITYQDAAGDTQVSSTVSTPWRSSSTATNPDDTSKEAFHTGVSSVVTTARAPERASGQMVTQVDTVHDGFGRPHTVSDRGDTSTTGDETCTTTAYMVNPGASAAVLARNQLTPVQQQDVVSVRCDQTPTLPDQAISETKYTYDGGTLSRGLVTKTEELDRYEGTTPKYVSTTTDYELVGTGYARPTKVTDPKLRVTETSYVDTAAGLNSQTKVTSPDPDGTGALTVHETTTEVDPAWGSPIKITDPNGKVTSGSYDALGRLKQVWEPGRPQATATPNTKYAYWVRTTGLNAVITETLNHDASAYVKSTQIFDGLLRSIQTQAPSASDTQPGRVVTDTIYDSRNLPIKTNDGWYNTSAPVTTLAKPTIAVPSRTVTQFDGAGRAVNETFYVGEDNMPDTDGNYDPSWTTLTTYAGDRVHVNPPAGGTPTTTINDARGNTIELRQYEGATHSGTHHDTTYKYDHANRLESVTDDAGNQWGYEYDLRGRQTLTTDPDKGTTETTYDEVGNVLTTKDARNQILGYTYDALDRKTTQRSGGVSGTVRAKWAYDTVQKGQLTSSSRVEGTAEYITAVTGYSNDYQPTGQKVTLPTNVTALGSLAGTSYTTGYTYTQDGRLYETDYPAAGQLSAENVRIHYGAANLPDALSGAGNYGYYVVAATHSPFGELDYLDLGSEYSYQHYLNIERGTRRLVGVTQNAHRADGSIDSLVNAAYAWDDAGNLTSVKDTPVTADGGQPADQQCYRYDWARRLTQAWTPSNGDCATSPTTSTVLGGGAPYWNTYSYNAIGNRTGVTTRTPAVGGTAATSTTSTYAYPTSGPGVARPHAVTGVTATGTDAGTSSFIYDASGNMLQRAVAGQAAQALTWDAEGELASVGSDQNGDGTVSDTEKAAGDKYVYTADGDRLVRHQSGEQGSTTTVYLPGGQELVLDKTTSQLTASRYYALEGKTVAVRTGMARDDVATIVPDHHNTAQIQITNVSGVVTRKYTDPFGVERGTTGAAAGWAGDHAFLDKPLDATGLTAVGARMYDTALGRFITIDPVMDLTDPQQWNAYSYSNNNPTTLSDPTGQYVGYTLDPGSGGGCGCDNGYDGGGSSGPSDPGDEAPVADPSDLSLYDEGVANGTIPPALPPYLTQEGWGDFFITNSVNFGIDTYHAWNDPALFWEFWGERGPLAWQDQLELELVGWAGSFGATRVATAGASGAARAAGGAASAESALLRAGGKSPSARLPMNMDSVCDVACKYDVDLTGVRVRIDKSRAGAYGSTAPDKTITLFRNAFENEEQLARTLAHERFHVHQIDSGMGYPTVYDAANKWEQAAIAFEDAWWSSR